jgi:hydroxymethylbilane synthase
MLVIGTRGSDLALWQARFIQRSLALAAGVDARVEIIRTSGDRHTELSLASLTSQGFFTHELEEALLGGAIDLAVHSHKDLPTRSPAGLVVGAIPERGPAADCLIGRPEAWQEPTAGRRDGSPVLPLRPGAIVGTGSARRRAQLLQARPDLVVRDLRGNVPTRLEKLRAGRYDAILLARAGLERLGVTETGLCIVDLPVLEFLPAPAQGALAVQVRRADLPAGWPEPLQSPAPAAEPSDSPSPAGRSGVLAGALGRLHHPPTARRVAAERGLLARLAGGCNLPLGAHAVLAGRQIELHAVLASTGGVLRRCRIVAGEPDEAAAAAYERLKSD